MNPLSFFETINPKHQPLNLESKPCTLNLCADARGVLRRPTSASVLELRSSVSSLPPPRAWVLLVGACSRVGWGVCA
jgi:hypothetical protein